MAVKAAYEVTITDNTDIDSLVTWYYLTTSATKPAAPTTTQTSAAVPSPWTQNEPTFTAGTVTNYLYCCIQTRWKDGSCTWGTVQLSSAYEQAKQAWNKANAAQDSIDNLEVGGRNLLRRTASPSIGDMNDGYWAKWTSGDTVERTSDGIKLTSSGSASSFRVPLAYKGAISIGETLTLSFDYRGNITGTGALYFMAETAPNVSATMSALVESTTDWVHFEQTFSFSGSPGGEAVQFMFPYKGASGKWLEIKDSSLKLERGNVATDWTPAPEDMATPSDVAAFQPFIIGTQTAATRFWTGNCPELSELRDGQQITYWLPYAYKSEKAVDKGITAAELTPTETITDAYSNDWLKLTLADGTDTGWIPCYYGGTSRMTSHYGAANAIHLTYRQGYSSSIPRGWWGDANYNTNTNDTARYVQYYNTILTGEALVASSLIGAHEDGKYYQLSGSGDYFILSAPLLWLNKALSSGATDYANIYTQIYDRNLGAYYTSFVGGAVNSIVYLVGTVDGNKFILNGSTSATYLTCTVPTSEQTATDASGNRLVFIPLGKLGNQSNGKNYFNFQVATPVSLYAYIDGKFRQATPTEVVKSQVVYYRSNSNTVPTAPTTSWVATATLAGTSADYNTWILSLPPLAVSTTTGLDKYPYLFSCTQYKRLDGTIECSTVAKDHDTLVVDGDAVINGSLAADKIISHSITADHIQGETITANEMKPNTLTITQLNSEVGDLITTTGKTAADLASAIKLRIIDNVPTITLDAWEITDEDGNHVGAQKFTTAITNTFMQFQEDGQMVTEISNKRLYVTDAEVTGNLMFGGYAFIPRSNGNLSLKWIGSGS